MGRHVYPSLGALLLAEITPERVRLWHAGVGKVGATTAAGLPGAARHSAHGHGRGDLRGEPLPAARRGPGPRRRAAPARGRRRRGAGGRHARAARVRGALRLGELIALEHRDLALDAVAGTGSVRVERAQQDVDGVPLVGPPRAESVRTVNVPTPAVAALVEHLAARPVGSRPPASSPVRAGCRSGTATCTGSGAGRGSSPDYRTRDRMTSGTRFSLWLRRRAPRWPR